MKAGGSGAPVLPRVTRSWEVWLGLGVLAFGLSVLETLPRVLPGLADSPPPPSRVVAPLWHLAVIARSSYQGLTVKSKTVVQRRVEALRSGDPVLVGAGDIASCTRPGAEATAKLLDGIPGTVFTVGDNAYQTGTAIEFAACYDPTWGRHKSRTRPAPGNHEYMTEGASGYFGYFGAAAGDPGKGYYSYDLGTWHIIVLNSNCSEVGGCGAGSPQEQWLRADLAAHPAPCTLAYWHHPRFSSGRHGSHATYQAFWHALYDYQADVVLSAHAHDYERFAPQDPGGVLDPVRGIREFVVGTGGGSHHPFPGAAIPNSEVRNDDTFGVLKLTLHPAGYEWQFAPEAGKTFTDSGTGSCH